jgi:hypothetical protein
MTDFPRISERLSVRKSGGNLASADGLSHGIRPSIAREQDPTKSPSLLTN